MRKNWLVFILATVFVTIQYANAQTHNKIKYRNKANDPRGGMSDSKKLRYADDLYRQGSYFNAVDYYQQLKSDDERNPFYTYRLAECYQNVRDYVPAAHYYAEAYSLDKKDYPLSAYYAGLMLKQQGEYEAAKASFNKFLTDNKKSAVVNKSLEPAIAADPDRNPNPKEIKIFKKKALVEIKGCDMAIKSIKNPEAFTVINAGPNVNTSFTELSPFPLGDSALLFSTMGRNAIIESNGYDNLNYKEHFMITQKQRGYVDSFQWPLTFVDGGFNDASVHEGNGCFSPGGDRFYFTKCKEGDSLIITCSIYVAKFEMQHWGASELVKGNVNEEGSSNTMPFVAKVGKKEVLFFSSNRKLQSRGGYDIWYSIVDPRNGTYRRPQNAGKLVNTKNDEITPYYDSRVNKLYFSTNGLQSMGGFDIYEASGGPSRYTNLKNMGYPINTSADELYYIKDPLGKPDAYVVSNRIGSYALKNPTCCNDIWRIQGEPKLIIIGRVLSKRTQELMPQTVVKMIDQKGEMNTFNSEDGNFTFTMQRTHSYVITGDKPGYTSTRASVSTMEIKRSDPDDTVLVTIYLDSIRNSFSVSNIYYDYDKATLRAESVAALDSVVHFLTDNPSITVEIYSYTDAKGRDDYNIPLSQRRAQSVLDYLEKNGVDRGRLTAKGFGSKNAAAPNDVNGKDNPEGRQLNRRTEFRIVTDVPTRRVIYNSALPGSMDQQEKNLHVEPEADDEAAPGGAKKPVKENNDD
jgi:outer membrane protein OmpA-like peptidoglycan-associated protein